MALTPLTRLLLGKYRAFCQAKEDRASFEQLKSFHECQRQSELTDETNIFYKKMFQRNWQINILEKTFLIKWNNLEKNFQISFLKLCTQYNVAETEETIWTNI